MSPETLKAGTLAPVWVRLEKKVRVILKEMSNYVSWSVSWVPQATGSLDWVKEMKDSVMLFLMLMDSGTRSKGRPRLVIIQC